MSLCLPVKNVGSSSNLEAQLLAFGGIRLPGRRTRSGRSRPVFGGFQAYVRAPARFSAGPLDRSRAVAAKKALITATPNRLKRAGPDGARLGPAAVQTLPGPAVKAVKTDARHEHFRDDPSAGRVRAHGPTLAAHLRGASLRAAPRDIAGVLPRASSATRGADRGPFRSGSSRGVCAAGHAALLDRAGARRLQREHPAIGRSSTSSTWPGSCARSTAQPVQDGPYRLLVQPLQRLHRRRLRPLRDAS